mmetsp:Transcript_25173/g.50072  ORF Transcript_25173/g.50072 Transcript_25173/m.50072 type:complete len:85 (+) Transcript_25173:267-521(+)
MDPSEAEERVTVTTVRMLGRVGCAVGGSRQRAVAEVAVRRLDCGRPIFIEILRIGRRNRKIVGVVDIGMTGDGDARVGTAIGIE